MSCSSLYFDAAACSPEASTPWGLLLWAALFSVAHAQSCTYTEQIAGCSSVPVGESTVCTVTVSYVTGSSCTLPDFEGPGLPEAWSGNADFSVQSSTCTGNVEASCTVGMLFTPTAIGSVTGEMNLFSSNTPTISFYFSATAVSGVTYSWQAGAWGSCTGGSGSWVPSGWTPASGCGSTEQTRTASCSITADSGSESRTVTCEGSDGSTGSASDCTGTEPATTQACTPTSSSVCGTEPSTTQTVDLTNACDYAWEESAWTPLTGCGLTEQTRTVSCLRSDGTTAPNSDCPGTAPTSTQSSALSGSCPSTCTPDSASGVYCVLIPLH